jgi:hypothetical protein
MEWREVMEMDVFMALKVVSAALLLYIAYKDYKTHLIIRWHGILFLVLSALSALHDPYKAGFLLVFSVVLSVGFYMLKTIRWFDGVILTGAVLMTESLWLPFLVMFLAAFLYFILAFTGKKPRKWVPYTPFIVLGWLLLLIGG